MAAHFDVYVYIMYGTIKLIIFTETILIQFLNRHCMSYVIYIEVLTYSYVCSESPQVENLLKVEKRARPKWGNPDPVAAALYGI